MRKPRPSKRITYQLNRIAVGLVFFVVFAVITIVVETGDQAESSDSCFVAKGDNTPRFYASIYRAFLDWKVDDTKSQVVTVVIKTTPPQEDLCDGRGYLADVIRAVAHRRPRAVVIDKYFSPNVCLSDKKSTEDLKNAVTRLKMPVIVGESTERALTEADNSCLVQKDQLGFGEPNGAQCAAAAKVCHGLLRLNANKEQIPLRWAVLPKQPPVAGMKSEKKDSLSLVTAIEVAPSEECSLRSLQSGARQPYMRIEPKPEEETSTEVLSSSDAEDADVVRARWHLLSPRTEPKLNLQDKVVVIGAESDADHWELLGEPIYGYQLQALYIDALLSGRYLHAASGNLTVWLFLGFLAALEGVPVLMKWLYVQEKWAVPYVLREHTPWICVFSLVSFVATILCFSRLGYLPPLLMLFGILTACLTRLAIAGSKYGEYLIAPDEELHR